jgi:hypothetical protein
MDLPMLVFSIVFLVFCVRYAFFWWFHGNEYAKMNRKKRMMYRKKLFFMPQIIMFDYSDRDPIFEIWLNRVFGLLLVLAGVLMVFVVINGPF